MAQPDQDRMFTESLHPRVPAGKHGGGEFGKAGGNSKAPPPKSGPHKVPKSTGSPMPKGPLGPLKTTMAYDPKTGRGPGYGVKGGDPHVRAFQEALNRLGLSDLHGKKLTTDGMLGPLTTQAIKAAQRRLGDKPDGQMTPALYKQLLAAKSLPAKKTTATPAKQAAAKATPKPVVTHIVEKRMSAIESARSQMEAANVAVGLPPPMSTQTAMSDQDCEQALMAILADMSDDELAELAQAAEDAQNEAGGGY